MDMMICEKSLESTALWHSFLQRTAFKLETYWNWIFKSSPKPEFALSIQNTNSPRLYNCETIMLNVMKFWDALDTGMHARAEQSG